MHDKVIKTIQYATSNTNSNLNIPGTHKSLAILTTCVRGNISENTLIATGRFSSGETTPEKKNIGDMNPEK